ISKNKISRNTPCKIVIIEDNVDTAMSLRDILRLEGHTVAMAHNGKTGIELAKTVNPDFIICDIGLPGVDGYTVAREIKQNNTTKNCILIALSGYAMP